jgi:hypothetical protein
MGPAPWDDTNAGSVEIGRQKLPSGKYIVTKIHKSVGVSRWIRPAFFEVGFGAWRGWFYGGHREY